MYLTGTAVALVRSCSASARSSYVAQRDAFGKKLVSFVPCRVQPGELGWARRADRAELWRILPRCSQCSSSSSCLLQIRY